MPKDFVLPELAESVVEGEVVRWLVAEGDAFVVDQPLVEVMTDKVTVELPAPFAGVLVRIVAPEGAVLPVGAVLA
ncbi:MAG: 2-oxo acid dehydrogenase subunit E2, partial [bacterium]|nr:2-oxo acid dehydrogenase subunit E2 [bacterium]